MVELMSDGQRCPSCGHVNEEHATACSLCNFPLHPETSAQAATPPPAAPQPEQPAPPAAPPAPKEVHHEAAEPAVRGFDPNIRRLRPIRPRRPRGPQQQLQTQLWVVLGATAVLLVLFTAFQGFKKSNVPAPVEGAQGEQQHIADMARAELAKDSTNVNARIALANILYDTGNWSEAIVHYKSAQRTDPDRVETIVDLGVCYYNLSQADEASALFRRALELNPNHPIALFNLGIVTEGQDKLEEALKFYNRALKANPPESMRPPLDAAIQRVMTRLGRPAPAAGGPAGGSSGMPR
jgi:cytochrome c-type biogenesis protein CcmH/NrfG